LVLLLLLLLEPSLQLTKPQLLSKRCLLLLLLQMVTVSAHRPSVQAAACKVCVQAGGWAPQVYPWVCPSQT
jgi:hypothetical protein